MGQMNWLRLRVPIVVTVLAAALMWAIAWALPGLAVEIPVRLWIAAALALLGCGVAIWAVVSFRRAKTTVNPLNPDATSQLLVHGIYGRSPQSHVRGNTPCVGRLVGLPCQRCRRPALILPASYGTFFIASRLSQKKASK